MNTPNKAFHFNLSKNNFTTTHGDDPFSPANYIHIFCTLEIPTRNEKQIDSRYDLINILSFFTSMLYDTCKETRQANELEALAQLHE
ncbi:CLUMA_CG021160, isoform A [Clunio marinus]|uniref:CLUMA_CG021160, isoform A n=1 Tax=Clunio marinus TaxID=568069 RepID=A0A1J1JA30_9DIPT|nr:CLUMA_CG021160, isoform A [Clunio marinus]